MKHVFVLCSLMILASCATAAQRQATTIKSVVQEAATDLKACTLQIYSKPEYETIIQHLPSPANNYQSTMAQLADDTRLSKEESQLLIEFHDDLLPCRQVALQKIQSVLPSVAEIFAEEMVANDQIAMNLVKRKITWGEGARQHQQITLDSQKRALQIGQQVEAALNASHQAELAQRQAQVRGSLQAVSNALQQWSNARSNAPTSQMTNTHCYTIGNDLQCQSNSF